MKALNTIESRTTNVNGRLINYYIAGQGDPLVIIHGGLGDARTWLNNIAILAERYQVYAPDLPGFGHSQTLDSTHDIPRLAAFVDAFTVSLDLHRFYLMGHSIGGGVALDYALHFPHKVIKLVLIDSLCLGEKIALWVRITSVLARTIGDQVNAVLRGTHWLIKKLAWPLDPVLPLNQTCIDLGGNITIFKAQTLVLKNKLADLLMPTLVVWGDKDNIVPVEQAYRASEVIPHCSLKIFKKTGHDVHRKEIGEFSRVLTGFLEASVKA